jgi:hypothetical protein
MGRPVNTGTGNDIYTEVRRRRRRRNGRILLKGVLGRQTARIRGRLNWHRFLY